MSYIQRQYKKNNNNMSTWKREVKRSEYFFVFFFLFPTKWIWWYWGKTKTRKSTLNDFNQSKLQVPFWLKFQKHCCSSQQETKLVLLPDEKFYVTRGRCWRMPPDSIDKYPVDTAVPLHHWETVVHLDQHIRSDYFVGICQHSSGGRILWFYVAHFSYVQRKYSLLPYCPSKLRLSVAIK